MYCIPFMDPPFYDVPLTNILTMRILIWPSSFLVPEKEKQRERVSIKIFILLWLANDVFFSTEDMVGQLRFHLDFTLVAWRCFAL